MALQAAPGQWPGPSPGTDSPLDCLCPSSAYRIAFGPCAGQKVFTLQGAMPLDVESDQELCADHQGNSAARGRALRCRRAPAAGTTMPLRHPTSAGQRSVQINSAGQVVLKLKTAWCDGTTHIVMSPLEFMQRLAARANEGRLSGTRAPAQAARGPLPWGAGAQCQAEGTGGAAWPRKQGRAALVAGRAWRGCYSRKGYPMSGGFRVRWRSCGCSVRSARPNFPQTSLDATPLSGRASPSGPENMPFEKPYSLPFIAAKAEGLDADPVARHGWLSLGVWRTVPCLGTRRAVR